MVTYDNIIRAINELPVSRLEEVYEYVHSLNESSKTGNNRKAYILSFAGLLSDMSEGDISDYDKCIQQSRERFFDRPTGA